MNTATTASTLTSNIIPPNKKAYKIMNDIDNQNGKRMSIEEFLDNDERKDLLRFLTAGSVDDGKSTLIGRLLFDSKKIYEDQLDALERDSKRMGNAGDHIDYALLLDGLKAGDKVIVEGLQKIRPGALVRIAEPTPAKQDAPASEKR